MRRQFYESRGEEVPDNLGSGDISESRTDLSNRVAALRRKMTSMPGPWKSSGSRAT